MPAFWQSLTRDLHAPIRSFNAAKDVRNRAMLAGPASHHPALCSDGDLLHKTAAPLGLTETRWAPRVDVGIGIPPGEDMPAVFIRGMGKRPVTGI